MLLEEIYRNKIKRILIAHQFHFAVGATNEDISISCSECLFHGLRTGCYFKDVATCPVEGRRSNATSSTDKYLDTYKKNSDRRIRNDYKSVSASRVIKLDEICINRLRVNRKLISSTQQLVLTGLVSLQAMGICTISLWIDGYRPECDDDWRSVSDPSLIEFDFSMSGLQKQSWHMNEFVRYLALNCHTILNSSIDLPEKDIDNIIVDETHYHNYLSVQYKKSRKKPLSYNIVSYPLTFIEYDIGKTDLTEMFENPNKISDARLFLYGDAHWAMKSDRQIIKTVKDVNVSSRDSIFWLATSLGTLKVAARDLEQETSIEESFTAMLLETDIVLTMHYFLMGMMGNLADLSKKCDSPITVSEMKEQVFINMDEYFNINISHNDQTIRRLEHMKEVFHVDELYNQVKDRIDVLSVKISNENSATIERQQIFLTLIFGLFGSAQVLYAFFYDWLGTKIHIGWIFLISIVISALITLFILLIMKKIKSKNNKTRKNK